MVCKVCGNEFKPRKDKTVYHCPSCEKKSPVARRFGKARDDVRELLGLERMGDRDDG